jgi:hypothetical protein
MWPWIPTGPNTKIDCAGSGQQQFTGLDKYTPEVTYCFMIFRPGVNDFFIVIQKVLKGEAILVTGHGGA